MFPKNANKQLDNAFFIEMLDVFINSILYLREVYPAAIFQKRKFFDTAVYISSFKPLNSYLEKVLKTAEELKDKNELRGVEVTLYKLTNPDKDMTDETVLEKYVIHVYKTKRNDRFNKFDEYKREVEFRQEVRKLLLQMEQVLKTLTKLKNCRFRVHLETTKTAFNRLVNQENSKVELFPWVMSDNDLEEDRKKQSWKIASIGDTSAFSVILQRSS